MKTLKSKIEKELRMIEEQEQTRPDRELDHSTLDLAYKLSKAIVYLDKAGEVMEPVPAVQPSVLPIIPRQI